MITAVTVVHIIAAVALVLIVLLQTGRGSEIGAAFGSGASQTLFGSSGTSGFMTRLTTGVVVIFMVTSLVLAIMHSNRTGSVKMAPPPVPVEESAPAPAPAVPAPVK
jgi:preprotein translocase subunit SecG